MWCAVISGSSCGCITGKTTGPQQLAYNQFLIWRGGTVKNFELRAKIKQSGNNTGIQYRSKELTEVGKWSVGGYQCDVHPSPPNNAMVYEERARGAWLFALPPARDADRRERRQAGDERGVVPDVGRDSQDRVAQGV